MIVTAIRSRYDVLEFVALNRISLEAHVHNVRSLIICALTFISAALGIVFPSSRLVAQEKGVSLVLGESPACRVFGDDIQLGGSSTT